MPGYATISGIKGFDSGCVGEDIECDPCDWDCGPIIREP